MRRNLIKSCIDFQLNQDTWLHFYFANFGSLKRSSMSPINLRFNHFLFWSTSGPIELKFATGINNCLLILNFILRIWYKYILKRKNDFFLYFWLIFVEASSENVVAMATRKDLSLSNLVSKHHLYIFSISHKVSRKIFFCCLGVKI